LGSIEVRVSSGAGFSGDRRRAANLAPIYGKLGIRSRAELGARMLERDRSRGPAEK